MVRIRKVIPLENFVVRLELTNGKQKTVDLLPYMRGPVFEPLRKNMALFRTIKVDKDLGTIVWKNGADIDPDVLLGKEQPTWLDKEITKKSLNVTKELITVKERKASYSARKKKRV